MRVCGPDQETAPKASELACLQVVVAPPELHWQSFASPEADGALTGEVRHPEGSLPPLGMSARRIIAYRAMLAIEKPRAIINLGVGMPEVCLQG